MRADYSTYQRATGIALLGLAIQAAIGLALLFLGIYTKDPAAKSAATYVLTGLIAWLALAVIFDQHRRERIESLEAETLDAAGGGSSVFQRQADELRVAARRLNTLYRWFVPAAGLLIAGLLIGLGVWQFNAGREALSAPAGAPIGRGWSIAIGLGVAFVGFLFARFVSGMAKQKVWTNLRGGAAFAAGAAIFGLAMAVAHFVDIAGSDSVRRYLPVIFPAVAVALGAEVLLFFVLDLYRPRKAGEHPRPAFDSRVLGLVAAPDKIASSIGEAINYQLGFDVTGNWFYRLLVRVRFLLVIFGVLVLWTMSAVVVVRPHQQGLVLRFGRLVGDPIGPGLHFKLPWPIDRVEFPAYLQPDDKGRLREIGQTATGVRTLQLGTQPTIKEGPILWTNEHSKQEHFFLVQSDATGRGRDGGSGASLGMVAVEVPVQYSIRDIKAFESIGPPEDRDRMLTAAGQRELMHFLSSFTVNDVLGGQRTEISRDLRKRVQAAFDAMNPDPSGKPRGAGVEVLSIGVEGVHPPQDEAVALNFERVVGAEQRYFAALSEAKGDATAELCAAAGSEDAAAAVLKELEALEALGASEDPKAVAAQREKVQALILAGGGAAAKLIMDASAERWSRHMGERSRLSRYQGTLGSYLASPAIFKASLYFDAIREAVGKCRIYIADPVEHLYIRLNLENKETGTDVLNIQTGDQGPG